MTREEMFEHLFNLRDALLNSQDFWVDYAWPDAVNLAIDVLCGRVKQVES